MRVINIVDEDFVNYKKPSMFIGTCFCDFKCCIEAGIPKTACQNAALASLCPTEISDEAILKRYLANGITSAVVIGGMEPFLQFYEIVHLLHVFRANKIYDEFVVYTGYNEDEIQREIQELTSFPPVIVKFGRYMPDDKSRFDEVLGVTLASSNQYGKILCKRSEDDILHLL